MSAVAVAALARRTKLPVNVWPARATVATSFTAANRRSCWLTSDRGVADKRVMSTTSPEVLRLAAACAVRLRSEATAESAAALEPGLGDLLAAVQTSDARFAFDRDGRPGAIAAVREALPVPERELLDAILEDHACELAAVHEAMFQIAKASAKAG